MRKSPYFYCLIICFCFLHHATYSQVGINTIQPRKDLEVNGDMRISEDLIINELKPILNNQDATFLIQDTDNKIRSMDVTGSNNAALGYIKKYILDNPNGDWVRNFDTKISADNYSLTIISAFYDRSIYMNNRSGYFTIPNYSTFIEGGTWRLEADYPAATSDGRSSSWIITVLIYSKDLAKTLPNQNINMRGSNTETANNPLIN